MESSTGYIFLLSIIDPVAATLPFLGSALPVTTLLLSYLLFVLKIGTRFMEKRKPYNLKKIIIAYNMFQVIYNAMMFYYICKYFHIIILRAYHKGLAYTYFTVNSLFIIKIYDLGCMETLPVDSPFKFLERKQSYFYFINKIIDLLDTIFFVLRKSNKQITFLHVYHHMMMVYTIYWVVRLYGFAGQFSIMALLNTFVHIVMYLYYLLSALNTELKGSLWWKKYITLIQIIQFAILLIHSTWMLTCRRHCQFPHFLQYMQLFQAFVMMTMFSKFYITNYLKPKKPTEQIKQL